jgi:hypothetical protein
MVDENDETAGMGKNAGERGKGDRGIKLIKEMR